MSVSTVNTPQPLRSDEQPLAGYRTIAPLALVAVGLGIASALILTTPLLAPLPVAGVRDGQSDMLVLKYSYRPAGPEAQRQGLWVHINRRFDESTKRPQWEVSGVTTTPPPSMASKE